MQQSTNKILSIADLPEEQQIARLYFLSNNKVLDQFIRQCEILIIAGLDLASLSKKYGLTYNLINEYESMKRVLSKTKSLLVLANSPDEGWKVINIDGKCTLSVRINHTIIEMKSRGTLQCNIKCFFYLAYLMKLYTHCLPFCKESQEVMQPTKLEKVGFIRLSLPIPFTKDRCTFMRGIGFDRLEENGTVCIFSEGINQSKEYLQKNKINIVQKMKGRELLDLKHFAVELKYITQGETYYNGYVMVDHHMPAFPESLVMFVAKETSKYLFNHLLKKLKNFETSIWKKEKETNYEENREFYDWVQSKTPDLVRHAAKHQK